MGLAATKQEAFWEACGFGNVEEVKMYIEMGTDVNWKSYTVSYSDNMIQVNNIHIMQWNLSQLDTFGRSKKVSHLDRCPT